VYDYPFVYNIPSHLRFGLKFLIADEETTKCYFLAMQLEPYYKSFLLQVKRSSSDDEIREPFNSNGKSRYLELVMVVDNKKYKELGGDLRQVMKRTKDVANIVNAVRFQDVFIP